MDVVLSKKIKQLLIDGFPSDVNNPIQTENGCTYMRFDMIQQSNMIDALGGIKVEYFWRGLATHWHRLEGIQFKDDMVLTLSGLEGRQRFNVE